MTILNSATQNQLTERQRLLLVEQLNRDDLQVLTAVRMARLDIEGGSYHLALCRLRTEADKLRDEKELYSLLRDYFN